MYLKKLLCAALILLVGGSVIAGLSWFKSKPASQAEAASTNAATAAVSSEATDSAEHPPQPGYPKQAISSRIAELRHPSLGPVPVYDAPGSGGDTPPGRIVVHETVYDLERDKDGKVVVRVLEPFQPDKKGFKLVTVRLMEPPDLPLWIAEQLRATGIRKEIRSAQVVQADTYVLRARDASTELSPANLRFGSRQVFFGGGCGLELSASVPDALVTPFCEWIRQGSLRIEVEQEVYAEEIVAERSADIQVVVCNSVKQAMEACRPVIPGDIEGGRGPVFSLKQADEIEQKSRQSVRAVVRQRGEMGDNGELDRVVAQFISEMFSHEILRLDAEKDWAKIPAALGMGDAQASEFNKLRKELQEKKGEERNKLWRDIQSGSHGGSTYVKAEADGGFGWGLFDASVSGEYSSSSYGSNHKDKTDQESSKTLSERGAVFEMEGNVRVLVGFDVRRVGAAAFNKMRDMSMRHLKTQQSLSPSSRMVCSTPDTPPALKIFSLELLDVKDHETNEAILKATYGTAPKIGATLSVPKLAQGFKEPRSVVVPKGDPVDLIELPKTQAGEIDRQASYLLLMFLTGENGYCEPLPLFFRGGSSGVVAPIGCSQSCPVRFVLGGNTVKVYQRSPESF
jgi:hypothetical protein